MKTVDFLKSGEKHCRRHREHHGNHNVSPELLKGIKVEGEHKGTIKLLKHYLKEHGKLPQDKKIYKSIACEHLKEDPKYYKKLAKFHND